MLAAVASAAASSTHGAVPRLIFPVVGPATYSDDFGDARGQGGHQGNDIMAPRKALAVAVEAGTVRFHTTSWRAGCMLYLDGRSGTSYRYIHLNNDVTAENDNRGGCAVGVAYPKGLRSGARVAPGQPVGYVGDSGDADGISPHLHFEVHPAGRGAVSPYQYLRRARRLLFAADPGTAVALTLRGRVVAASPETLKLRVDQLAATPSGLRVANVGRTVELAVAPTAELVSARGLLFGGVVEELKPGQRVTVSTEPAAATLAAQLGQPLALTAARVALSK